MLKKVFILSNDHKYTYNFRGELIQKLIDEDYEVTLVLPYGEKIEELKKMGCKFINIPLDRRGKNALKDFLMLLKYLYILSKNKPDIILSYTIKPNIYGGISSRLLKIPFFPNITGIGSVMSEEGYFNTKILKLYSKAISKSKCIFFQNEENFLEFYKMNNKVKHNSKLIPGSGVNLKKFELLEYPKDEKINFTFASRIMKEKGIEEFLEAAKNITDKYSNVKFHVAGYCEENYLPILSELHNKGVIEYHGAVENIIEIFSLSHCIIHPSYYPEGISNILLESAASGRPIITTDHTGCKETIIDDESGYLFKPKNVNELINKIENFINLSTEEKKEMGIKGREYISSVYDRDIVVSAYIDEIKK